MGIKVKQEVRVNSFDVKVIRDGVEEDLGKTLYHSQSIIQYIKENDISEAPILIQSKIGEEVVVEVMGVRGITFKVVPTLSPHRYFVNKFLFPTLSSLEIFDVSINLKEEGIYVSTSDTEDFIAEEDFTKISIRDLERRLGQ